MDACEKKSMSQLQGFIERCNALLPKVVHDRFIETLVSFKHGDVSEADADHILLFLLNGYASLLDEYNRIMEKARPFSNARVISPPVRANTLDFQRQAKRMRGDDRFHLSKRDHCELVDNESFLRDVLAGDAHANEVPSRLPFEPFP